MSPSKPVSNHFSARLASDIVSFLVIVGFLGNVKCGNSTLPRLTMTAIIGPALPPLSEVRSY